MKNKKQFFPVLVLIYFQLISGCVQAPVEQALTSPVPAKTEIELPVADVLMRDIDGMSQIVIPGGTFLMGSTADEVDAGIAFCRQHYQYCNRWFFEEEYPQHQVTLKPYQIDQLEISNHQYQLCVDDGACQLPLTCEKGEPTYLDEDKIDHPVVCVSWQDAWDYCEWAGGRLPTEAEWEYASKGADGLTFPWGNDFDGSILNYCDENCEQSHADPEYDDGYAKTSPVGSYTAGKSWTGVFGLGGNVSEWVDDWYSDYGQDPLIDPVGPETGTEKVIKGSSWYFPAVYSRGANRGSTDPAWWTDYIGFRCAADPLPVIDGVLEPGEWDGAAVVLSENGSELYLLRTGNELYLGIRSNPLELVSGNVFITDGKAIRILHESAALGTAIYQVDGQNWKKTSDFEWCCRSRMDTDSARAMRKALYHTDSWLGINSFNGIEGELEYMIELDGSEKYLAVNITSAGDPEKKQVWPAGIEDGPALVLSGEFPEVMDFAPKFWINLSEIK